MALQKLKWVYPVERGGFEEIDENRNGNFVYFDAPAGTKIFAPLAGLVTAAKVDPRGGNMWVIEIQSITDDGSFIYNTIDGLGEVLAQGVQVKRGEQIGVAGVGDYTSWDMSWVAYLNLADDSDGAGSEVNPLELASEMGGISYKTPLKEKIESQPEETLPATIEPYIAPEPASNKKDLMMWGLGGLGLWYFLKKGKK